MKSHVLLQVSDTHFDPLGGPPTRNWDRVVAYVAENPPSLVVHTGDVLLHEPDDDRNHDFAKAQMTRLAAPWCVVPGNHDVGDGPPKPWLGEVTSECRRERYLRHWGPDHWARPLGEWLLLGLNSMLLGTGLASEAAQWQWLDAQLAENRSRPIVLFLHKPLFAISFNDTETTDKVVPIEGRRELIERIRHSSVRVVASGHCHEYRTYAWRGIAFVWAPTTAFITKGLTPPGPIGIRRAGCVRYRFVQDTVTYEFVEPDGLELFDNSFLHRLRKAHGLPYNAAVLES